MEKTCSQEIYCFERNYIGELVDVMDYLVVLEREVYALREPRELCTNIKEFGVNSKQNINIKK